MPHKWNMIRKIIPSIYSLSNGVTKEMIVVAPQLIPFSLLFIRYGIEHKKSLLQHLIQCKKQWTGYRPSELQKLCCQWWS